MMKMEGGCAIVVCSHQSYTDTSLTEACSPATLTGPPSPITHTHTHAHAYAHTYPHTYAHTHMHMTQDIDSAHFFILTQSIETDYKAPYLSCHTKQYYPHEQTIN